MIYFNMENIKIRTIEQNDAQKLCNEEIAQGWHQTVDKYLERIKDYEEDRCIALVAEYDKQIAGYVNVYRKCNDGPWKETEFPEIVDFGVLEKYRQKGIGTRLMDVAEQIASELSDRVTLGVGLHSGYGNAQRMYVKRGYIPDGTGVWYEDKILEQYAQCCNDDELILYMNKIF